MPLLSYLAASLLVLFSAAFHAAQRSSQAFRQPAPDLVLLHGKIFTADSARPWVEGLAIHGERIVAVGSTAAMWALRGRSTRTIDLRGRVVIPGINDAHDHVSGASYGVIFSTSADPVSLPDPSLAQVVDSLRTLVRRTPPGTWLRTDVGMRLLGDPAARRDALDSVAPSHPVSLEAAWGHGMILNTAALRALRIPEAAADPLGGSYERDAGGRVTGRLDEYARWHAQRRLRSALPDSMLVAGFRRYAERELQLGITSVQDMATGLDAPTTVRVLRAARLPIRFRVMRFSIPNASGRNEVEWETVVAHPAPLSLVSGRKWILDGTPIEGLGFKRAVYPGRPKWHGRLNFPLDTIRAMLASQLRRREPLALHVTGDSTAVLLLSAMEGLAPDSVWQVHRVRIEHGFGGLPPDLWPRARRLGLVIVENPSHFVPIQGAADTGIGLPLRTLPLDSVIPKGIVVALGSDGEPRSPFVNMLFALSVPTDPPVSRELVITAYTRGSAYAEFAERDKGTLAPGMLADLAVLSQNIFTVPARALPGTSSVLTLVGGKVAYDAGVLGTQ
jgi:predicted amidohydrolase YtcJ